MPRWAVAILVGVTLTASTGLIACRPAGPAGVGASRGPGTAAGATPAPAPVADSSPALPAPSAATSPSATSTALPVATPVSPLAIPALRARDYPGGAIEVVQTLQQTPAYTSYLVAYPSDGLRISGVMKVPRGDGLFPVVVLNHGHYPVSAYRSGNGTDNAADLLARAGYLTLASDYRGFGASQNDPAGQGNAGHRVEYAVDVLNLLASVGSVSQADAARVGMWGHSMGGEVGLRALEADGAGRIKAAVFWAPTSGDVNANSRFYARGAAPEVAEQIAFQLSPINYVDWVAAPVSLHQGDRDTEVRPEWTLQLRDALQAAGNPVEFFWYPGQGHNFAERGWGEIGPRTVAFFEQHVRGTG